MPATTVYYHADCLDGFGAAYAAWCQLGNHARYIPLHHGDTWSPEDVIDRTVYILDFAFAPVHLREIAKLAHKLMQIDHHASALTDCAEWVGHNPALPSFFQHPELPLTLVFDLSKSGTRLSWEHFHPHAPFPLALQHIENQDLWHFTDPATQPFCRALRLQEFDFANWQRIIAADPNDPQGEYQQLLTAGNAINDFFHKEVARLCNSRLVSPARLRGEPADALQALRHGQPIIGDGERHWHALNGLALNTNALFASEAGHRLAEQSGSFGLTWQLAADGEVKASLRSQGDYDVATIAQRYGGGGHRNAAGFRLPLQQFISEILGR